MNRWKLAARLALALLVLAGPATVAASYVDSSGDEGDLAVGDRVAPPREGTTVIATDSNTWLGRESGGPRATAELVAIAPNGTVAYVNDSHTRYWDVDPVAGTHATVEYVYADHLTPGQCGGEQVCTRNGVERVNLTTGEVTPVYSRVTAGKHSTRWHDVDRLDAHRLVVADIARDRVYVVNATTGLVTWSWSAQAAFPTDASGGPYPGDWTHLNDVEVLDDGTIMASLRNHDQVVFLDRETGLIANRTLGADGRHGVLYEQHNPDYISAENGGPAVLVADSENNRVVEYHRTDAGNWTRSWRWRDARVQWPRDADRLPGGTTLVTDSNGNRVLEVAPSGEVVWSVDVAFPYEAERLGTGDESTGGQAWPRAEAGSHPDAATGTDAANRTGTNASAGGNSASGGSLLGGVTAPVAGALDGPLVNAVMYVLPVWMSRGDLAALLVAALAGFAWVGAEAYWSAWTLSVHRPVELDRTDEG